MNEALRRRAQLGPSSVGAATPPTEQPQPGQPGGGGAAGAPTAQAVSGLKQQVGEAETITKALISRLKALGERNQ
jgi:hypothetical protein